MRRLEDLPSELAAFPCVPGWHRRAQRSWGCRSHAYPSCLSASSDEKTYWAHLEEKRGSKVEHRKNQGSSSVLIQRGQRAREELIMQPISGQLCLDTSLCLPTHANALSEWKKIINSFLTFPKMDAKGGSDRSNWSFSNAWRQISALVAR